MPIMSSGVCARAAQEEPVQVDGALVGPVQIVDDQDRRLRPQLVENRTEDVVWLIAAVQELARRGV